MIINPASLIFTPSVMPEGVVGVPYPPTKIKVTNGVSPVTYSLDSGVWFPGSNPIVDGDGDLLVQGTPTEAGSFPIVIKAVDANGAIGYKAY